MSKSLAVAFLSIFSTAPLAGTPAPEQGKPGLAEDGERGYGILTSINWAYLRGESDRVRVSVDLDLLDTGQQLRARVHVTNKSEKRVILTANDMIIIGLDFVGVPLVYRLKIVNGKKAGLPIKLEPGSETARYYPVVAELLNAKPTGGDAKREFITNLNLAVRLAADTTAPPPTQPIRGSYGFAHNKKVVQLAPNIRKY